MIEFKNYTCDFNTKEILTNINLKINKHLIILGSNGSGKSTLVKSICNLLNYKGDIFLDGKNVKSYDTKSLAKKISYIPTKLDSFDEYINVFEYLLLSRFVYKKRFFNYSKEDYNFVDKNLKLLNISHLKNHTLHSLSSGEASLVLIASALTSGSKTIIFDEPTANLDPKNTKIIAKIIKNLKTTHNILLITHDLNLAKYLEIEVAFVKNKNIQLYENNIDFDALVQNYD